ncbi:hypothetical protein ACYOEI_13130 [Singulisphaera rosea]
MNPLAPDSTTLAVVRALFDRYRAEGLDDAEVRRRILDDLTEALPPEAIEEYDLETIIARWQRVVESTGRHPSSLRPFHDPAFDESAGRSHPEDEPV